jgi:hypothetical protein
MISAFEDLKIAVFEGLPCLAPRGLLGAIPARQLDAYFLARSSGTQDVARIGSVNIRFSIAFSYKGGTF